MVRKTACKDTNAIIVKKDSGQNDAINNKVKNFGMNIPEENKH